MSVVINTCPDCGADAGTIGVVAGANGRFLCVGCKLRERLSDDVAARAVEHDAVNHPRHYTAHKSGVECITVVECFNFNLGNAIKYIWRAGEKGHELEDLKKSAWYLSREIDRLSKETP